jgi:NADH-quinone oxidoreductase subunit M
MNFWNVPWLEVSIAVSLVGSVWVSRFRNSVRAFGWGLAFTAAALFCALLACLGFYLGPAPVGVGWSVQPYLFGRQLFAVDELSAPLVVLVALLHFLTALATGRTKMRRFSLSWSLASEALRLATFASQDPWLLIGLLAVGTVPPYLELVNRRKPTRVYVLHMALFVGLLVLGWAFVDPTKGHETQTALATLPLLAAVLIRCGTVPAHCWVTDWFEHASFGNALLYVTPLLGVYAAVRLVLPIAPDWILQSISLFSLVTAVYAAGMSLVQVETRRFFAYLFLSHSSLVLIGLELHTAISLTGALALWISVALSMCGLGLTLRALEARFGRLSLADFHGLYAHSPTLAVCFVLMGLASVGFPGTLGFVSAELLVNGAVRVSPYVGLAVIVVAALNGIAVVRAYFLLFTGTRHASTVSLDSGVRERFAVITLLALIIGGGLYPQLNISSRYRAARDILGQRREHATLTGSNAGPLTTAGEPTVAGRQGDQPLARGPGDGGSEFPGR